MRSGGVALDGDCREGGTFAFSAIRLKLAFSEMSHYTFKLSEQILIMSDNFDRKVYNKTWSGQSVKSNFWSEIFINFTGSAQIFGYNMSQFTLSSFT